MWYSPGGELHRSSSSPAPNNVSQSSFSQCSENLQNDPETDRLPNAARMGSGMWGSSTFPAPEGTLLYGRLNPKCYAYHGQSMCRGHRTWREEREVQSVNTLLRLVLDVTRQCRARMLKQFTGECGNL